jgi:type IV pilus assembly protein PilQ
MKWMTKQTMTLLFVLAVTAGFLPGMIQTAGAAPETGQKPASKLAAIESISVSGEGEGAELVINLTSPTAYTSYKTSAPLRLVVDLSQTTQGAVTAPIVINKGNFKTVAVKRYDTDAGVLTRIDIGLVKDTEAVISAAPDRKGELRISFPAGSLQVSTSEPAPVKAPVVAAAEVPTTSVVSAPPIAVSASAPVESPASVEPKSEQVTRPAVPSAAAQPRTLTAISVKDSAIILAIEGGAGDFKSFRLNKPERFIVDLFDVKSALASRVVPVNAAGVALARIGLYPDKVRVVFDAVNGSFPDAVTARSDEGVTISLNAPPSVEKGTQRQAVARMEKAAEASLTTGTATAEPQAAGVPAEQSAAATPLQKTVETVAEQPVVKPVVPPAPLPAVEAPLQKPIEIVVEQPVVKPVVPPAPLPAVEAPLQKPIEIVAEQPVVKPVVPPAPLPAVEALVEKPVEIVVEQPVVKPVAAPPAPIIATTPPVKQPVERPIRKPVEKIAVRPAGPATVEMIDFQVIEGVSRVAVKVAGDVTVAEPVKTPGFITLTIKNAGLPKRLQRSLETKQFASPVLRVTPILVKTRRGTDTRIKIALRTVAPYEFRQEGDMLFVDVKTPEKMKTEIMPSEFQEPRSQTAASAKASSAKETEIQSALDQVEPAAKPLDTARIYKGRKVTLEFADAEVRKIFQLLSEVSNKNFVLGDDVTGTISIKLVNVPWDQALEIILDTKGLDKREDGNIIIIKGKGKFKSEIELEQENKKLLTRSMEMKTETFNVNYANIADIKGQFEKLKQHEKASITDDARTNKVIVRDVPQAIEEMRKLKEQLDVPEKQVMIEARIVEATSTFTRNLGINWGVHYRDGSASFLGINNLDTGFGGLTSAPPSSGTGTTAGGAMGISFGTLTSNIQLDMRLNAAASAGLIKIVSTPKVATLNNKTAKISQGQQIPYQNTTATTGAVTQFVAATLSLEVTPHINANGTIGMKIDAKNDAPGTGSPPPINTKSATTELLLRDGETTVIGGIYVDNDTEQDDGVPFLMDIPFFGKMFKSNSKSKTKTELLIFITPRIIGTI